MPFVVGDHTPPEPSEKAKNLATRRYNRRNRGRPHVGSEGERQPRLPGVGTGFFGGGSEAFEPGNWVERPPGGGRIAAFHASMEMTLPAEDRPEEARGYEGYGNHEDVDIHGRPMAAFGSAIGIHLGSLQAAQTAGHTRDYVHPVAIPHEVIQGPEGAPEEAKTPWKYRSAHRQLANDPVDTRNTQLWDDEAANFSPYLTDVVEAGKVIPYRNQHEDPGSVSYRGKPEALETWGEHVLATDAAPGSGSRPSQGQVAAARAGYEPAILQNEPEPPVLAEQMALFGGYTPGSGREYDHRQHTSHYGEAGGPEASKWDAEVRKAHLLAYQERATQGRDQRSNIVNKLSMIQAGRRE